jgi:hypothetical protein
MPIHSDRFGFDVPSDFPIGLLESVHANVSDPDPHRPQTSSEWREWAGACNAVLYRFMACAEHSDALVASLRASTSPELPERYRQEKLLFSFFAEGLSSLESLYYGSYSIGALVDPIGLDPNRNAKQITPRLVTERFEDVFATDPFTSKLRQVLDSSDHDRWRATRNVLTHRAAPGRTHHEGGPTSGETYWQGDLLDPAEFTARRAWLCSALAEILEPLDSFVVVHLT